MQESNKNNFPVKILLYTMKFVEDTFVIKTSIRDHSNDLEFTCDLYLT